MGLNRSENINIKNIVRNNLCTGCGGCAYVCPAEAITLSSTSIGRILPEISKEHCNGCGKCLSICGGAWNPYPAGTYPNDLSTLFAGHGLTCYIGFSKDSTLHLSGQSGGLLSQCILNMFKRKSIDAALLVGENKSFPLIAEARLVKTVEGVYETQKSKYVVIDLLKHLSDLDRDVKKLVVVGLPCHIATLRRIVDNVSLLKNQVVYMLGLICDQTQARILPKIFAAKAGIDTQNAEIIYKDKSKGGHELAKTRVTNLANKKSVWYDNAYRMILKEKLTPPRCRICLDKMNIGADIVFGDPWGRFEYNKKKGESLVLVRTAAGEEIFEEYLSESIENIRQVRAEDVLDGQDVLNRLKKVGASLQAYLELGFDLPDFSRLALSDTEDYDQKTSSDAKKAINEFLYFEKINESLIIKKIIRYSSYRILKMKTLGLLSRLIISIMRIK